MEEVQAKTTAKANAEHASFDKLRTRGGARRKNGGIGGGRMDDGMG